MRSYPSWIAGLRYRGPDGTNRGRYCRSLGVGTVLDLVPEPDNRHSANAVAVKHDGRHLGYIPDRHQWIAEAIEEGRTLSIAIRKVEMTGWLFRRASFVGLQVTVEDGRTGYADRPTVSPEQKRREKLGREACIDGLRVLAFVAMADGTVTPEETNLEVFYIQSRLAMVGIDYDDGLVDALLAESQGLIVTKRSLTRAVNIVAADMQHYKLMLSISLRLTELAGDANDAALEALERMRKAGKAKGWI